MSQRKKPKDPLVMIREGVELLQKHVEAGGANEELTKATIICSQVIDYIKDMEWVNGQED